MDWLFDPTPQSDHIITFFRRTFFTQVRPTQQSPRDAVSTQTISLEAIRQPGFSQKVDIALAEVCAL